MQFTYQQQIGKDTVNVEFLSSQKADVWYTLIDSFKRIGGKPQKLLKDWIFPSFITSQVIQEIINNTCFVCGGLMEDSTAMLQGKCHIESFDNAINTYQGIIKHPDNNSTKQVKVRKCSSCGHSHT